MDVLSRRWATGWGAADRAPLAGAHAVALGRTPLDVRRARLESQLEASGIGAALVSPGSDLRYLVGESHSSFERLTVLVIQPGSTPVLIVPAVESSAWESVATRLSIELTAWSDGQDVHAIVAGHLPRRGQVSVSGSLPASHLLQLMGACDGSTFAVDDAVRRLRRVKDEWEIEQLRLAARAVDSVHAKLPELLVPRRTEAEVASDVHGLMAAAGFEEVTFVAVASGENGANPHHAATARPLRADDLVFVDISGRLGTGYFADCTRTYALRPPSLAARRLFEALSESFDAAIAMVRPGVTAHEVDQAARTVLERHDLAQFFLHRTGHGIGLDVHESPDIVSGNHDVLAPGMTFSIEPGVYRPDLGARIEDIVVVTEHGCEQLNRQSRDLWVD